MRFKKIISTIAYTTCLLLVSPQVFADAKPHKKAKNLTSNLLQAENAPKSDITKYKNQLEAINLILGNEKNETKQYELYIKKANIHLLLAQALGYIRVDKAKMSDEEKKHLNESEKILITYEPKLKDNKNNLASLLYMRGLIHYEFGRTLEMIEAFKTSISLDSKNKRVPGLALIIAEYLYDADHYKEAISYYTAFQKSMTPYQKALANYKIAWSYIGLGDYNKGFDVFFKQIKSNEKNNFTNDSIKDLSFFMAQVKTEDEIIKAAEANGFDIETKSKFYLAVIESFMTIDKKDKVSVLFTEALKIQKNPVDRLKTRLYKLLFARREYPTHLEWELIGSLNEEIKLVSAADREKFFFTFATDLEAVMEHYIKNVLEVYNGKMLAKGSIKKENSFYILYNVINIFSDFFPQSPKTVTVLNILIDLCQEASQLKCLTDIAAKSTELEKKEPQFKPLYKKAILSRLVIWEKAYDKDNEKYMSGFTQEAESFLAKFESAPENLKIRKKLVGVYLKSKANDKALVHAEKNIQVEPTLENYKPLLLIYFEKQQYQKIIDLKDKIKSFANADTDDVLKETYIKLAEQYKKADDYKKYFENIMNYLAIQKDPAKRSIVMTDAMYTALKKEDMTIFIQLWDILPAENKKSPTMASLKDDVINYMIQSGDFRALSGFEASKPIKFTEVIYKASLKMTFDQAQWGSIQRLKDEERLYFYSNYVLENPETLARILKGTKNAKEKVFLDIAKSLNSGVVTKEIRKAAVKSKVLAKYNAIQWPSEKLSVEKYSSKAEKVVGDVRYLRNKAISELKDLELTEKLQLLKVMSQSEKKCSEMLTTSPLPANLTAEQVTEYKKGLADLAVEFNNQSAEFAKLSDEVDKKIQEVAKAESDKILPEFNSQKWPWPGNGGVSQKAQDLADKKSLFAALVYLDRQLENKKIDNAGYVTIKVGLIANVNRTEAGRELARQELVAANKSDLLEVWKGFAK
ncbi:hypothetical protein CIK05_11660 [Bdellovibrio sp. qaytius]|nr:hypothetical protein CIK05_11660 [Bdellovibrio sp. qaytius]